MSLPQAEFMSLDQAQTDSNCTVIRCQCTAPKGGEKCHRRPPTLLKYMVLRPSMILVQCFIDRGLRARRIASLAVCLPGETKLDCAPPLLVAPPADWDDPL